MFSKKVTNNLSNFGFFLILLSIKNVCSICVGSELRVCLSELTEEDAQEKLQYVLSKYEEVEMKITGTPQRVNGKQLTYSNNVEEIEIGFSYVDNTEYDILQYCVFILTHTPGQCESITTICNPLLSRTPRPLLERETLTVCEDGVARQNENNEDTVQVTEQVETEQKETSEAVNI